MADVINERALNILDRDEDKNFFNLNLSVTAYAILISKMIVAAILPKLNISNLET